MVLFKREVGKLTIKEACIIKKKPKCDRIKYIAKYDSHAQLVECSIKKHWYLLQNNSKFGKLFREKPLFVYKKGKTIGNYLVRSDIAPKKIQQQKIMQYTEKKGTFSCNNCQNCNSIIRGAYLNHPSKGHKIPIK